MSIGLVRREKTLCRDTTRFIIKRKKNSEAIFALLIAGSDEDKTVQTTFIRDTQLISAVIQHPRVMGIPSQRNVIRIEPSQCSIEIVDLVLLDIMKQKPDFFFFYYSGHDDITKQPYIATIRERLRKLARQCPRILVIIDCCEAASVPLSSLLGANRKDDHVRYHVQWSSCGRKQESNFTTGNGSEFTGYLLAGLRGARTCPLKGIDKQADGSNNCEICIEFRTDCSRTQCIKLNSLRTFVDRHVIEKQSNKIMNVNGIRRSIMTTDCREDPCIAYFTGKPLYSIIYESPKGKTKIFSTDSVDGIQQELWGKMKNCLPPNIPENALSVNTRLGTTYEPVEITETLTLNDIELLYVSIRTDGTKLTESDYVAFMCNDSQAEKIMRTATSNKPEYDCKNYQHKRWRIEVNNELQLNQSQITGRTSAEMFKFTAMKCWDSLVNLAREGNSTNTYYLVIDVFDNVTIFSIATEAADQRQRDSDKDPQPTASNFELNLTEDLPSCSANSTGTSFQ